MRAPMSSSFKDPRIVAATVIVTASLVGLVGPVVVGPVGIEPTTEGS
jgi:hypothetical protein